MRELVGQNIEMDEISTENQSRNKGEPDKWIHPGISFIAW